MNSFSYVQYVNALHSQKTKEHYTIALIDFLKYAKMGADQLLELEPKKLQAILISYIVDMKDNRKLSPNTMKGRVAALKTFFQLNDFEGINWFKVKKYIGEFYRKAEDRPYTRDEIKKLVETAHTIRDKAIILLLASSGMRKGAIIKLQLKHLKIVDEYNIFLIDVYKQAREHYCTFCTPEARKAIEDYLNWRAKLGEKLTPESPLFREQFDIRFGARGKPKSITEKSIRHMLTVLRTETGIVETQHLTESIKVGSHRSEIMTTHGMRKFFDTICTNGGMSALFVELLMGHNIGLKGSYYKPTVTEILEGNDRMNGYVSVINDLTINEENRLRLEVKRLTIDKNKLEMLEQEMNTLKELVKS
jgi:integrase